MSFGSALYAFALAVKLPFVMLALAAIAALPRVVPQTAVNANAQRTVRAAGWFCAAAAIAVVVAALMATTGRDARTAEITALGFTLLAWVWLGNVLVFGVLLPRLGIPLPRILADIVTAIAIIVVLIVTGKRAGFSVAGLITTSAVLTAVLGFALQDTLGNIMGGLALQMDNSVKSGDWISLGAGQPQGRVTEIRWRYTAIETRAWETIVIPNAVLMRSQVTILGRRHGEAAQWRRSIDFFVDYDIAPTQIVEALAALGTTPFPSVAAVPSPHVLFTGYREQLAQYSLRYWLTELGRDDIIDSEMRIRLWYHLARAGIAIAVPTQHVTLTAQTPTRQAHAAALDMTQRLAALDQVELFAPITAEARTQLAAAMQRTLFAAGETVTKQGDTTDELYVIVAGTASVRIATHDHELEVARLGPGQFFGEMSLLTGEARAATVAALTDLHCYRIAKLAFSKVLAAAPQLAEPIADVLTKRREALLAAHDNDETQPVRIVRSKQDLIGRIRGFFGIEHKDKDDET